MTFTCCQAACSSSLDTPSERVDIVPSGVAFELVMAELVL